MTPSRAIDQARQEMAALLKEGKEDSFRRYVWQLPETCICAPTPVPGEFPVQGDPWSVLGYGPPDQRPYYVITLTGKKVKGIPVYTDKVELFNRPDYARATVWDRLSEPPSEPPSR